MIIVNFSTDVYARAQTRLRNSLLDQNTLMYTEYEQIGSPTHQESPYEFKIHAIEKASQIDPIVLWVDSSMYRVGLILEIEHLIKRDGYFMEEAGHYVHHWCNAHTREYFGLSEHEKHFIMFSAGLLGLDFNNDDAVRFFKLWKASALAGCFRGDWSDHRHDMTCASIIAQRMGFKYQRGGSHLAYVGPGYAQPEPQVVFHCQGML